MFPRGRRSIHFNRTIIRDDCLPDSSQYCSPTATAACRGCDHERTKAVIEFLDEFSGLPIGHVQGPAGRGDR